MLRAMNTMAETRLRLRSGPVLEIICITGIVLAYAVAFFVFSVPIRAQIGTTVAILLVILFLCWRNMGRGLHPLFFFFGLLLLFQGGRLLVSVVQPDFDPMQVVLATTEPFDVSIRAQRLTLFAIVLSAAAVFGVVRALASQIHFTDPPATYLTPYLELIFWTTFPFHLWKNYQYFSFARANGGYLAIYLHHAELLASAGFPARVLSAVCSAAFVVCICYERSRRRFAWLCIAYLGASTMELLLGLRGKVLMLVLCLWFLRKLKTGGKLRFGTLAALALALIIISQSAAAFRERLDNSFSPWRLPAIFLSQQGMSMQVTETTVAFYSQFSPHRLTYLVHDLLVPVMAEETGELGQYLDEDIGWFLSPEAARAGYGPGGSYLAEAYALGRLPGVFLESVIVGLLLAWMARSFRGTWTPFVFTMMLFLLYIPRDFLGAALSRTVLNWVLISGILALAWLTAKATAQLKPLLRAASARIEQRALGSGADHF